MWTEYYYVELLKRLLVTPERPSRAGTTQGIFGVQLDVRELTMNSFPLLCGRKIFWKGVAGEVAAILKGPKKLKDFKDFGCNYWDAWAGKKGELEVDYGNAWLDFNGVNQLKAVVDSLKNDPYGRRHLITGWKPDRLSELSLPCCHYAYQWYVTAGVLHMAWIQRSVDVMVGLPSDIIFAAVLNILMAQTVGLKPGNITMQLGDVHMYTAHREQALQYLDQYNYTYTQPLWKMDQAATVFNFKPEMLTIDNYTPGPVIKFEVAV
jgi:thymidylate synthase